MVPNCKKDSDTLWQEAKLTNNFSVYNNSGNCFPIYRKIGRLVELKGVIKPNKKIEGNMNTTEIFTLPDRI